MAPVDGCPIGCCATQVAMGLPGSVRRLELLLLTHGRREVATQDEARRRAEDQQ